MDGIEQPQKACQKALKLKEEERNSVVSQVADVKSEEKDIESTLPVAVKKVEKEEEKTKNAEIPPEKYESKRVQCRSSLRAQKRVVYFEKSDEESEQESESKLVLKFVKQEPDDNNRTKRKRTENWKTEISENNKNTRCSHGVRVPMPRTIHSSNRCDKDAELSDLDKKPSKIGSPTKILENKRGPKRKNKMNNERERLKKEIKMEDDEPPIEKDHFSDVLKIEKETVSTKTEDFRRVRDILSKLKIDDQCGVLGKLNESELAYLDKIVNGERGKNSYKSEIVEEKKEAATVVTSASLSSGTTATKMNRPRIITVDKTDRYAIPPVTDRLPEKIFESDSDDDDVLRTIEENDGLKKAQENDLNCGHHHPQFGSCLTQDQVYESQLPVLFGDLGLEHDDDITVLDDFFGNGCGRSIVAREMESSSAVQHPSVVDQAREVI